MAKKGEEKLHLGDQVFCAECGKSYSDSKPSCPECKSKRRVKRSILWCEK